MKKIMITGTEGFVGKHLREFFAQNPAYTLHCPGQADLDLTSTPAVADYLAQCQPDIIIHSATSNTQGKGYASDVCEQNLRMFFNLERQRPAHCTLYSLCSGSSYNRADWQENMSEDYLGQHIPEDGQGFSKFAIAMQARQLPRVVVLRLFGIFGPYEDYRYKFISNTVAKRLLGLPVTLARDAVYHYLDVEDFCALQQCLIERQIDKGEFNITPDRAVSLREIIETVDRCLGIEAGYTVLNPGQGKPYTGNNQRLKTAVPDVHFTPLEDSIRKLIAYHQARLDTLDRQALEQDSLLSYAKTISRT